MTQLAIAFGGAMGAVARYLFPYGTLGVNVLGAFGLACINGWLVHQPLGEKVKLCLTTGFMGAFTTFSTLSIISCGYLQKGQVGTALAYSLGSLALGMLAATVGFKTGFWLGKPTGERSEASD